MNWVSIDFGTSYSAASVMIDNEPVKVAPMSGLYDMYAFPTVAYVDTEGKIKVCNEALPWRCECPERFIKDFKLNIHENEMAFLDVTYVDVIAAILRYVKASAEYALGNDKIEGVILTIPAEYTDNDPRREIMAQAARDAGFTEIKFIREAEAAAIYYHHIQRNQSGTLTLIYDLGGSTFDPALVEHLPGEYKILGSASGRQCGGKFFEAALYRHFKQKYGFDFSSDDAIRIQQVDGIAKLCKDIKEALSTSESVSYPVPLMPGYTISCTRVEFEQLIKPLLEKTYQECTALIASAGRSWADVSRVLLIGGSCAIPCVQAFFKQYLAEQNFPDIPIIFNKSDEGLVIDSLYAVSLGGLLSHIPAQAESAPTPPPPPVAAPAPPIEAENFMAKATAYKVGFRVEKNLVLAAHYYYKEYERSESEEAFNAMSEIFQQIYDKLEISNGRLQFKPIVDIVGQDAVDYIIDILMAMQNDVSARGEAAFVRDVTQMAYWIEIAESVINQRNT